MSFCGLVKFAVNTAGNNLHLLYGETGHAFRVRFREKRDTGERAGTRQAPSKHQLSIKRGLSRGYVRTDEELSNIMFPARRV